MKARASAALDGSYFGLLDARGVLRLVIDTIEEDDALFVALVCKDFRDALHGRFPIVNGKRFRMGFGAVVSSVSRLSWAHADGNWQYLHLHFAPGSSYSKRICMHIARNGQLDVLQFARSICGFDWDWQTCAAAAGAGHLHVLEYAKNNFAHW